MRRNRSSDTHFLIWLRFDLALVRTLRAEAFILCDLRHRFAITPEETADLESFQPLIKSSAIVLSKQLCQLSRLPNLICQ